MSIALPAVPSTATIKSRLVTFNALLTPTLGGPSQRVGRLGARYAVDVDIPTLDAAQARSWVARRLKSETELLTLTLAWPQPPFTQALGAPVVDGAGQTGSRLAVRGLTAGVAIPEGVFFSFAAGGRNYLHCVTTAGAADGTGRATLAIGPLLRASPADGAALQTAAPLVEGFLDGTTVDWTVDTLTWAGVSFTLTENG